jgi:flagellar basal-body rod protein FlgB
MINSDQLSLLGKLLDVSAHRQGLISSNIANIDTPGYRTKDIDFKSELRRSMLEPDANIAPVNREVTGLTERPDGNNVSIDRETMLLSETQLQFRLGIQLMRSEFHKISMAINDGKG